MAVNTESLPTATGRPKSQTGLILALIATVLWSTSGPFIEVLGRDYGLKPVALSFWRTLLIAALLGPWVWKQHGLKSFGLSRPEFGLLALNGIIGIAVFSVSWSASAQLNGTAVATTLLYSAPVFVALGGWLFLKKSIGLDRGIAIGVSVIGCALVAGVYDPVALYRSGEGVLLGLVSGLTFGFYILLGKFLTRYGQRPPVVTLFYVFFFGTLTLLPWGLLQEGTGLLQPNLNWLGWLLIAITAYGPTLGGYAFFNLSLKYLPAAAASLITTLEQPIAALLSLILFGRGMTLIQWVGAILIVSSVLALQAKALKDAAQK